MIRARAGAKRVPRKPLESVRVEVLKRTFVTGTVEATMRETIRTRWPVEFARAIGVVLKRFNLPTRSVTFTGGSG